MTDTMTNRLSPGHIRVLIQEMDRARRVIDDAQRIHDSLAAELGFERVRVNEVEKGVQLIGNGGDYWDVAAVQLYTDEASSWFRVTLANDTDQYTDTFDDGQMVSRRLPESQEPF